MAGRCATANPSIDSWTGGVVVTGGACLMCANWWFQDHFCFSGGLLNFNDTNWDDYLIDLRIFLGLQPQTRLVCVFIVYDPFALFLFADRRSLHSDRNFHMSVYLSAVWHCGECFPVIS